MGNKFVIDIRFFCINIYFCIFTGTIYASSEYSGNLLKNDVFSSFETTTNTYDTNDSEFKIMSYNVRVANDGTLADGSKGNISDRCPRIVKNIFKVAVLGFIGWSVYKAHFPTILGLSAVDNKFAVLFEFGKLIIDFVTKACIIFLAISAADYMVVRMKFLKDQKMSYKEIKDEYKNSEGDPHVKAALRQRRQQLLQQKPER